MILILVEYKVDTLIGWKAWEIGVVYYLIAYCQRLSISL